MVSTVPLTQVCRMCVRPLAPENHELSLIRPHDGVHSELGRKYAQVMNVNLARGDPVSTRVCAQCAQDLEACFDVMVRGRLLEDHYQRGSDLLTIHEALNAQGMRTAAMMEEDPPSEPYLSSQSEADQSDLLPTMSTNISPITLDLPSSSLTVNPPAQSLLNAKAPPKAERKILPKTDKLAVPMPECAASPSSSSSSALKTVNGQVVLPVHLVMTCPTCSVQIVASSVREIQDHACPTSTKPVAKCALTRNQTRWCCTFPGCSKILSSPSTLKYHLKYSHSSKKEAPPNRRRPYSNRPGKFACSVAGCSKSYVSQNYLVEHTRIHTGERPFKCDMCDKSFYRILDLKKHQLLKVCS